MSKNPSDLFAQSALPLSGCRYYPVPAAPSRRRKTLLRRLFLFLTRLPFDFCTGTVCIQSSSIRLLGPLSSVRKNIRLKWGNFWPSSLPALFASFIVEPHFSAFTTTCIPPLEPCPALSCPVHEPRFAHFPRGYRFSAAILGPASLFGYGSHGPTCVTSQTAS